MHYSLALEGDKGRLESQLYFALARWLWAIPLSLPGSLSSLVKYEY